MSSFDCLLLAKDSDKNCGTLTVLAQVTLKMLGIFFIHFCQSFCL